MEDMSLSGVRVLIVEDDYSVAKSLRWLLSSYGADVVGAVSSVTAAIEAVTADPPEVAILDVTLKGERVFPVVSLLRENDVPFVFLTGRGQDEIPLDLQHYQRFAKPVPEAELVSTLRRLTRHEAG